MAACHKDVDDDDVVVVVVAAAVLFRGFCANETLVVCSSVLREEMAPPSTTYTSNPLPLHGWQRSHADD
jgi:hypothetical protein